MGASKIICCIENVVVSITRLTTQISRFSRQDGKKIFLSVSLVSFNIPNGSVVVVESLAKTLTTLTNGENFESKKVKTTDKSFVQTRLTTMTTTVERK